MSWNKNTQSGIFWNQPTRCTGELNPRLLFERLDLKIDKKHRNHSSRFKAKVAVAALKGGKTLVKLAEHFDIHPSQINGFVYRVVIMEWHGYKLLNWRLSDAMNNRFCVNALVIFNTVQDVQYTREYFKGIVKAAGVIISIDGKGHWVDDVIEERICRSIKYQDFH